jgi:spermidine dehydrogenase
MSQDLFRLTDPFIATANFGISADALSGYAAKIMGLPGTRNPAPPTPAKAATDGTFSFPGGNSAILRHIVKALLPNAITGTRSFADILSAPIDFAALDRPQHTRIRLNATVIAVKHDGDPETSAIVDVTYAVGSKLQRVRGRGVMIATGGWIARHITRDMPESYVTAFSQFHHSPILVANVALRNWQPFAKLGITSARWFDGFGFFANVRQPMVVEGQPVSFDPAKPAMLTLYVGYPQTGVGVAAQTAGGRAALFGATYAELELQVRQQLQTMFGAAGFDAKRDIAGIIFNRWGHAYIAPQPGFYFGSDGNPPPLDVVRQRYGRIAFGHSELSGRQSWGRAVSEARRALAQLSEVIV